MNPQAEELNVIIKEKNPVIFDLLTEKGKEIFFPKKGILGQTADAKGKRINATIGSAIEDDGSPMRLASIEKNVNLSPDLVFPYAPSFGRPDIRAKWREMMYEKNPSLKGTEVSLPIVTNALTHGLSIIAYLFLDEKSELIIPDLYWGNYNLIFKNAFGVPFTTFNTFKKGGFDVLAMKEKLVNGKVGKKAILLNFPNNPTGYSPTVEEYNAIISAVKESAEIGNKIIVICDDAYFGLVYEKGIEKESIFAKLAGLHKNVLAIKADGPTKEDYVWGFRTGFITYGNKADDKDLYTALEAKTAGAVRGNISNACNLSQTLLLKAYESNSYKLEKEAKYKLLEERYKKVKEVLNGNPQYKEEFEVLPFNSGYFMCVKLREGLDGEIIRRILLDEFDTGIINMAGVIRIAFSAVAAKDIAELFENIYQACKKA